MNDNNFASQLFTNIVYVDRYGRTQTNQKTDSIKSHFLREAFGQSEFYMKQNFFPSSIEKVRPLIQNEILMTYDIIYKSCSMATLYSRYCNGIINKGGIYALDLIFFCLSKHLNTTNPKTLPQSYTILTHRVYRNTLTGRYDVVYGMKFQEANYTQSIMLITRKHIMYMYESVEDLCKRKYFQCADNYDGNVRSVRQYISEHSMTWKFLNDRLPDFDEMIAANC